MNERMPVHPIEVRGREYRVMVDENGRWWGIVDAAANAGAGQWASADTREGLRQVLLTVTRKAAATLDLPVLVFTRSGQRPRFVEAVARGRHGGTGNVVLETAGRREQVTDHWREREDYYRTMPELERQEGLVLYEAFVRASHQWEAWQNSRKVDLGKLVDAALERVATEPEAAP